MTIGQRIKKRRLELNMSQEELAKKMGYQTRNAIYQFEKKDNMKLSLIQKFADALNTTTADLAGWEEMEKAAQEIARQIKPVTDFLETHEIDYNRIFDELSKKYGKKEVERAFRFTRAFLSASPERQQIVLDILQSHQGGS